MECQGQIVKAKWVWSLRNLLANGSSTISCTSLRLIKSGIRGNKGGLNYWIREALGFPWKKGTISLRKLKGILRKAKQRGSIQGSEKDVFVGKKARALQSVSIPHGNAGLVAAGCLLFRVVRPCRPEPFCGRPQRPAFAPGGASEQVQGWPCYQGRSQALSLNREA